MTGRQINTETIESSHDDLWDFERLESDWNEFIRARQRRRPSRSNHSVPPRPLTCFSLNGGSRINLNFTFFEDENSLGSNLNRNDFLAQRYQNPRNRQRSNLFPAQCILDYARRINESYEALERELTGARLLGSIMTNNRNPQQSHTFYNQGFTRCPFLRSQCDSDNSAQSRNQQSRSCMNNGRRRSSNLVHEKTNLKSSDVVGTSSNHFRECYHSNVSNNGQKKLCSLHNIAVIYPQIPTNKTGCSLATNLQEQIVLDPPEENIKHCEESHRAFVIPSTSSCCSLKHTQDISSGSPQFADNQIIIDISTVSSPESKIKTKPSPLDQVVNLESTVEHLERNLQEFKNHPHKQNNKRKANSYVRNRENCSGGLKKLKPYDRCSSKDKNYRNNKNMKIRKDEKKCDELYYLDKLYANRKIEKSGREKTFKNEIVVEKNRACCANDECPNGIEKSLSGNRQLVCCGKNEKAKTKIPTPRSTVHTSFNPIMNTVSNDTSSNDLDNNGLTIQLLRMAVLLHAPALVPVLNSLIARYNSQTPILNPRCEGSTDLLNRLFELLNAQRNIPNLLTLSPSWNRRIADELASFTSNSSTNSEQTIDTNLEPLDLSKTKNRLEETKDHENPSTSGVENLNTLTEFVSGLGKLRLKNSQTFDGRDLLVPEPCQCPEHDPNENEYPIDIMENENNDFLQTIDPWDRLDSGISIDTRDSKDEQTEEKLLDKDEIQSEEEILHDFTSFDTQSQENLLN